MPPLGNMMMACDTPMRQQGQVQQRQASDSRNIKRSSTIAIATLFYSCTQALTRFLYEFAQNPNMCRDVPEVGPSNPAQCTVPVPTP